LERPELDLKETCQLFAQTIPVAAQISKIRDLVHHPTLKNSSACRQLSKLPGQARLHENMTQSFTLI
jgi:hypothetical protein